MGLAVAGAMESRIAKSANRTARLYITYKLILRLAVRKMTGKVVPVQERLVTVQKLWGSPCGAGVYACGGSPDPPLFPVRYGVFERATDVHAGLFYTGVPMPSRGSNVMNSRRSGSWRTRADLEIRPTTS